MSHDPTDNTYFLPSCIFFTKLRLKNKIKSQTVNTNFVNIDETPEFRLFRKQCMEVKREKQFFDAISFKLKRLVTFYRLSLHAGDF